VSSPLASTLACFLLWKELAYSPQVCFANLMIGARIERVFADIEHGLAGNVFTIRSRKNIVYL